MASLNRLLQVAPRDPVLLQAALLVQTDLAQWDAVATTLQALIEQQPRNVTWHVQLSRAYAAQGLPEEARGTWEHVLTLAPNHPEARQALQGATQPSIVPELESGASLERALALATSDDLNDVDEAVSLFEQLAAINPNDAAVQLSLAQTLHKAHRYAEAAVVFGALPLDQFPEASTWACRAALSAHDLALAQSFATTDQVGDLACQGEVYVAQNNWDDASAVYSRAAEQASNLSEQQIELTAWHLFAQAMRGEREAASALKSMQSEASPHTLYLAALMDWLLDGASDPIIALESQLSALTPYAGRLAFLAARARLTDGDIDRAISALELGSGFSDAPLDLFLLYGDLLDRLGESDAALASWTDGLRRNPAYRPLLQRMNRTP